MAIAQGVTTVVTFSANAFVPGMQVTFRIPLIFGMQELNVVLANILAADATTITVDVDSRAFEAFAIPGDLPDAYTPPQCIPNSDGLPVPITLEPPNERGFVGATRNIGTGL